MSCCHLLGTRLVGGRRAIYRVLLWPGNQPVAHSSIDTHYGSARVAYAEALHLRSVHRKLPDNCRQPCKTPMRASRKLGVASPNEYIIFGRKTGQKLVSTPDN